MFGNQRKNNNWRRSGAIYKKVVRSKPKSLKAIAARLKSLDELATAETGFREYHCQGTLVVDRLTT
jgi:hypothetical protein